MFQRDSVVGTIVEVLFVIMLALNSSYYIRLLLDAGHTAQNCYGLQI